MDAISSSSSPRRSLEMDRSFGDRGYGRIEHWPEEREEHLEFRDHPSRHDRKGLSEGRGGYSSPFDRGSERRPPQRYSVQGGERQFEEHPSHHRHHHHHHHHHSSSSSSSVYPGDKIRGGSSAGGGGSGSGGGGGGTGSREESGENWDGHREHIEHQPPLPPHPSSHPPRDRNYGKPNSSDWEDRSEWRSRTVWERENLQRPEAPHEEEWGGPPPRYDSPLPEWKVSESRNWESSQSFRGNYRNERPKDLEDVNHGKRRGYGNTPEIREECLPHVSKQAAIYGSMKDEPINKKLMELAEGRLRKSREKSVDSFHKKQPQPPPPVPVAVIPREKSVERKEIEQPASLPAVNPPKRPCVEESVPITPALHTESDLSDISDDPDDILNMEDEEMEAKPVGKVQEEEQREAVPAAPIPQELAQNSPKEPPDEPIFPKERDEATISGAFSGSRSIEDENMETMDFEEISDGELEEDIKTSGKGLGDALGVDWESLVKESRPRKSMNTNQNVKSRWQCKAIFQRIGISTKNAGDELVAKLVGKTESDSGFVLLDSVALMHSALTRKKSQESRNFSFTEFGHRESIDEEESDNEVSLGDTSSLYNEAKLLLQQSV